MPYIGSELAKGFATTTKQSFSGDASTVDFTLTRSVSQATDIEVFVDNVQQEPTSAYTVSSTTLSFTAAPSAGTNNIYVVHRGAQNESGALPSTDLGTKNYVFRGVISTPTLGTSNLRLGKNAGDAIESGGNFNVVIGDEAGTALTTGDENTFIGYAAGDAITTAVKNVAVGHATLSADTLGNASVAVGHDALRLQNFTTATNVYNTAVGFAAGEAITTGEKNTLVGGLAGDAITTGERNVIAGHNAGGALTVGGSNTAIGDRALLADTKGSNSVALGRNALFAQNFTTATDTYNIAIGRDAGASISTGQNNTLIGGLAGDALTDTDDNIAIGTAALTSDVLGTKTVAIGKGALQVQNFTTATDSNNTVVGWSAGLSVTTGTSNTLFGTQAGDAITTGAENVAVGVQALSTEDAHGQNTAVGQQALRDLNAGATGNNVAVGHIAGRRLTVGLRNTLIGAAAGDVLTDADDNVAVGAGALGSDTLGADSVAIGKDALGVQNFTTATDTQNVAVGRSAGEVLQTGQFNTFLGNYAGQSQTTANNNTLVGTFVGDSLITGHANVAVGGGSSYAALGQDTKGKFSVAIGFGALRTQNFTTDTQTNNTAVGYFAGGVMTTGTGNTFLGSLTGDDCVDGNNNTAVGQGSLSADAGDNNTAVGLEALRDTTGSTNTAIGKNAGNSMTTGSNNTFIGSYNGNQDSIDIRTGSNYIVLSDGASNVRQIYWAADGSMYMRQQLRPWANGHYNLGGASNKWAEVFASNATINTSDENEKQQVASLTNAEITAATAISKLFKTYKWNSAVETKGNDARIHTGVVAQQVKAAMTDAGLDASKYAFWCSDTWWTKDREVEAVEADEERGTEAQDAYTFTDKWENEEDVPEGATTHTVTGIRYAELLAFVCAATEQRLTNIESENTAIKARLDALEDG